MVSRASLGLAAINKTIPARNAIALLFIGDSCKRRKIDAADHSASFTNSPFKATLTIMLPTWHSNWVALDISFF